MNPKIERIEFSGYTILAIGRDRIAEAKRILRAANEEGTIQAWQARKLFSRPEHHTTMNLERAMKLAGFTMTEI